MWHVTLLDSFQQFAILGKWGSLPPPSHTDFSGFLLRFSYYKWYEPYGHCVFEPLFPLTHFINSDAQLWGRELTGGISESFSESLQMLSVGTVGDSIVLHGDANHKANSKTSANVILPGVTCSFFRNSLIATHAWTPNKDSPSIPGWELPHVWKKMWQKFPRASPRTPNY